MRTLVKLELFCGNSMFVQSGTGTEVWYDGEYV